ncbi:hypothetical protein AAG906_003055 [Vitis piasezkii]
MDERQNDLSQKIDNLQYSISRLTNLNIGESSQVREVKAVITLRSGKEVDLPTSKPEHEPESEAEKEKREEIKGKRKGNSTTNEDLKAIVNEKPEMTINQEEMIKKHMPPPSPQALQGKKGINNASKILEVLMQVKCKSPVKYKDLGCPTISVMIGETCVKKALLDLGASVNLLPYSVYKQLGLGEGMIEDVLVQVDKFYYQVDFLDLDTDLIAKGTNYIPIILGRPFLATSKAIINCRNVVTQLTFGNMMLELNIFYMCNKQFHPEEEEGPEEACMIDNLVDEHCDQKMLEDLNESFGDLDEGLPEPVDLLATLPPLKLREESLPLFNKEETQEVIKEEPPKLILKLLPMELKYAYLEENKCKKAIGWQISDLKGISPLVCTHHIYMEEEAKPIRQPQRRLNPHLQEVVRTEVLKLLQAGIIYPISDSPWVSPTQVVPKKKDHFPLPFIDQVLERVSSHPFYCFLDGYSRYFQIEIDVEDQEKTTFTCPFGTYAYRRMPFGLCNAPATFQRCMLSIFSDMVERIMEVFMDDITIYGGTFEECLVNLEAVLKRCIEKDLMDSFITRIRSQNRDKKGVENVVADHLSRLAIAHNSHVLPINDDFPEESLMLLEKTPWYAHIANYLVTGEVPSEWKTQDRKHFFAKIHAYYWEEPFLFKYCAD